MHKFFTPKELINGDVAKIIGDDVKHIYKVLRISEGEKVTLNNCEGIEYLGKVISVSKQEVLIEILEKLETKFIGRNIQLYDSLESTNKTAKQLARSSSAPDGTLIIAEEQKNGKGRFDRAWKSPKGGLWFSLILKPNLHLHNKQKNHF